MNIDEAVNTQVQFEHSNETSTLKERAADVVAEFGGSWTFIASFSVFVVVWVALNCFSHAIDPYPYILLNLILSCLSVFQAPFILMSQNRMANIDRRRAEEDYKINLKAELEIQSLHEKLDVLSQKLASLPEFVMAQ